MGYFPPKGYLTCIFGSLSLVVINKYRLTKYTIIGDKQLQKRERGHFEQAISEKEGDPRQCFVGVVTGCLT